MAPGGTCSVTPLAELAEPPLAPTVIGWKVHAKGLLRRAGAPGAGKGEGEGELTAAAAAGPGEHTGVVRGAVIAATKSNRARAFGEVSRGAPEYSKSPHEPYLLNNPAEE